MGQMADLATTEAIGNQPAHSSNRTGIFSFQQAISGDVEDDPRVREYVRDRMSERIERLLGRATDDNRHYIVKCLREYSRRDGWNTRFGREVLIVLFRPEDAQIGEVCHCDRWRNTNGSQVLFRLNTGSVFKPDAEATAFVSYEDRIFNRYDLEPASARDGLSLWRRVS